MPQLVFKGKTTFGYKEWEGPLIAVSGENVVVEGTSGHIIDCDGKRWWDGEGGNGGKKKPKQRAKLDENRLLGDMGFPQLVKDIKHFRPRGKGREVRR